MKRFEMRLSETDAENMTKIRRAHGLRSNAAAISLALNSMVQSGLPGETLPSGIVIPPHDYPPVKRNDQPEKDEETPEKRKYFFVSPPKPLCRGGCGFPVPDCRCETVAEFEQVADPQ